MDYGKFANKFGGVKKAQITLEADTFVLIQQGDKAGGRWQIALPGVEVPEEVKKTERVEVGEVKPGQNLWLIGCVKKWDPKKQFGFLLADGADDVFVHRNDLPEEIRHMRNLVGAEIAFELGQSEDGKPRAVTCRPIIQPGGRLGQWQLRRNQQ